ncbi:hypothetical protein [Roseibium sp. MMSF_3412]|uniref:hypothetical protein n=1 Tax=Roseibium sp. MMSF_3412 TaxID=3046712 RepID=UPI00273EB745|nr:hypothetical protein [Roseibium sp. MMSF_3412]
MQIPKIRKRPIDPPILMGRITIDLKIELFERRESTTSDEKTLQAYFAALLGIPVSKDLDETMNNAWVFNFTVTEISNETGAASYDILGPIGLVPWLLIPPTVSVSLEGSLTEARTGNILAEAIKTNSFETRRTFFKKKTRSLPMIEVSAVGLLKELKQSML